MAGHGADVHSGRDFVDVPIMAAYLVFVALLFVVINLIVDILYFVVDPRIRLGG